MEWINIAFFTSLFNIHYVNNMLGILLFKLYFILPT